MTEIYGSNPTADHKYFVVWKNNSVTLKTGHGTEPAARHHARLIIKNDVGTVLEVLGPNGPVLNWQTEGASSLVPRPAVWSPNNPVGGSSL